jgi:ubiquitin
MSFADNKENDCKKNIDNVLTEIYAEAIINKLKENVPEDKMVDSIVGIKKKLSQMDQKISGEAK